LLENGVKKQWMADCAVGTLHCGVPRKEATGERHLHELVVSITAIVTLRVHIRPQSSNQPNNRERTLASLWLTRALPLSAAGLSSRTLPSAGTVCRKKSIGCGASRGAQELGIKTIVSGAHVRVSLSSHAFRTARTRCPYSAASATAGFMAGGV
jgi:hypothetical protein